MNVYLIIILSVATELVFSFTLPFDNDKPRQIVSALVNETYYALDGQYVVDRAVDWWPFFQAIITDVKVLFFLFVFFSFLVFVRSFWFAFRLVFRLVWCSIRPCCRITRYCVPIGADRRAPMRLHAYGDDFVDPAILSVGDVIDAGHPTTSASISPSGTSSIPPSTNDRGDDSVKEVPVHEQENAIKADPLLEQLECEPKSNVMFSGKMATDRMRKRRRRINADFVYKEMDNSCYGKLALVASFDWSTTAAAGTVLGQLDVNTIARLTPRYAWLTRMWTFYRFGLRIVTVPQVNPMASGTVIMMYTPTRNEGSSAIDSRRTFEHFGLFPHAFMTPSSNQHAELYLDDVTVGRWLNNQDVPGFPATTIPRHFTIFGNIYWMAFNQLSVNTGGPTTLTFRVYAQLINIHAKLPQVIRANAQGLIDVNTNVIGTIRDSVVAPNVDGDRFDVNGTVYGMDYPSDRRQYEAVMRRSYQKVHHWNNVLDVHRASGSGRDGAMRPWEGIDETSLRYIASCHYVYDTITFATTQAQDSRIQVWRVNPNNPFRRNPAGGSSAITSLQSYVFMLGRFIEYDYVVFSFYVPKVPYQNGKYLVTVTSGIDSPATLESPLLSMSAAASMVIDLSGKELVHTLRIPFALVSELMGSGAATESSMHGIWSVSVYVLNRMTATILAPSTVNVVVTRHFEGLRVVYPHGRAPSKLTAFGDSPVSTCSTTAAELTIRPDKALTAHVDDMVSFKQLWHLPHFHDNTVARGPTLPFRCIVLSYSYSELIQSLPGTEFYRFFNGSLRLFLRVKPNVASGQPLSFFAAEVMMIPYSRVPIGPIPSVAIRNNIWGLEESKYNLGDTPYTDVIRRGNGYTRLRQYFDEIPGLTGRGVPETGKSFLARVSDRDPELIIEAPIVSPNGFTCYSYAPNSTAINIEELHGGGITLVIAPINELDVAGSNEFDAIISVDVAAGDDFEAHCINFAEMTTNDRIATMPGALNVPNQINTLLSTSTPYSFDFGATTAQNYTQTFTNNN